LTTQPPRGILLQSEHVITEFELLSGDILAVYDLTKVYFGDYCHVKLEIKGAITSQKSQKTAVYRRTLEKMAVPSANVDATVHLLLSEFENSSLLYLNTPDFAEKFIAVSSSGKTPVTQRLPWATTRA
jgi:hypothetical protein